MALFIAYGFIVVFMVVLVLLAKSSAGDIVKEYRDSYLTEQRAHFEDMFVAVNPSLIFSLSFIVGVALSGIIYALSESVYASVPIALILPVFMTFIAGILRKRRWVKFELQFPDALSMLNANMRAGVSLANALQNVARQSIPPMSQELGMLEKELQLGKSEEAYRNLARRIPMPSVKLFVSSVVTCARLGGNLTEMLDTIAATIRRNLQLRQELKTLTAEGRMQGIIMGLMPFFMAGILTLIDPELMSPLYNTTMGNLIIATVVVLNLVGMLVIREMLKIED